MNKFIAISIQRAGSETVYTQDPTNQNVVNAVHYANGQRTGVTGLQVEDALSELERILKEPM